MARDLTVYEPALAPERAGLGIEPHLDTGHCLAASKTADRTSSGGDRPRWLSSGDPCQSPTLTARRHPTTLSAIHPEADRATSARLRRFDRPPQPLGQGSAHDQHPIVLGEERVVLGEEPHPVLIRAGKP